MHGNTQTMAKSRKTKLVLVREPSGRPARATEQKEYAPVAVRRLLDAAMVGMADAEWGSALGRLYVARKVTAPQYAAGKRWAERVAKYHSAINAPPPNARALVIGGSSRGNPPDPDSDDGQRQARRDADAVTDFISAHCILVAAGLLAEYQVRATCERDQYPESHEQVMALNRGLLWLADHWHLTK